MAATKKRPPRKKPLPPIKIVSVSLTPQDVESLASLARVCTDHLGRGMSGSAVARALIRLADWGVTPLGAVVDEIERELNAGRKWGRQPKARR